MIKRNFILALEGNISSGKSTVINALKNHFKNDKRIVFAEEPLADFSHAELNGRTYKPLQDFYENKRRQALAFQIYVGECYKKQLKELLQSTTEQSIIIMDRAIYSSKIFINSLNEQKCISDFARDLLVKMTDDTINTYLGGNKFGFERLYYLNTPVEECMRRLKKRNRKEEVQQDDAEMEEHLSALEGNYKTLLLDFALTNGDSKLRIYYNDSLEAIIKDILSFLNEA